MSLELNDCSSLTKLPSSIRNAIKLKRVSLSGCSNLVELPSSIGNAINLKKLYLSGCTNLVELPSSIGNAINLRKLNLSGCTNLVKLQSSIGNAINLEELNLSGCTNLVELPSSIGNAINLKKLNLCGCTNLVELPSSIKNAINLKELNLSGCSNLMEFTNIRLLKPSGTAIEEVPSSLRLRSSLDKLYLSYIEVLRLSETRIQEIPPWIKELSCLRELVIKGCTKLVSLPEIPDSLQSLDAENCDSLERLHCSFHNAKIVDLNFANCFKLNEEARDLTSKLSRCIFALFPVETVPTHFTHRANGSSLSMKSNGFVTPHTGFVRLKACVLLVNKGDGKMLEVSYCIKEKPNAVYDTSLTQSNILRSSLLKKHLFMFDVYGEVSSSEFVFEVRVDDDKWEIGECGICTPTD